MQQKIAKGGADVFLGYPFVIFNTALLLILGRLYVHPKHFAAIAMIAVSSLIASLSSGTPITAITSQILGITLMSIYYFSVLTGFNFSLTDWMNLYARFAFAVAVFGILFFPIQHFIEPPGDAERLHAIFSEPSLYVFTTLPAVGWYFNRWLENREFGIDLIVFVISYGLADSSLGFLGLGLMLFFTFSSRLSIWKTLGVSILGAGAFTALFLASSNFRVRLLDTFFAISSSDLSKSNQSTFAFLSNAFVTFKTFLDYPLLGAGIGGYQYQYAHYITLIPNIPKLYADQNINMHDANSLFFRTLAELGVFALLGMIGFLVICGRVKGLKHTLIRNAILPFLIVRMARFGAYFSLEFFFFVALYLLNFIEYSSTKPKLNTQSIA
jgi:hypothetical protein